MKKFEEEFNYLIELSGKVLTGQIEAEKFEIQRAIFLNEYGQKQQPEIPEVPQFMDEWLKSDSLEDLIDVWYNHTSDLPENVKDYLDSLGEDVTTSEYCYKVIVHLIARAKLDGYTVKEKRFYLKHKSVLIFDPDSDDSDVEELYLGAGGNFVPYQHLAKIFTQSQVDSMETGSYEQIEVQE